MKKETDSYGFVLKFIHWTTALLIMGLLFVGFTMTDLPFGEPKLKLYMLHKSFGLLVLILAGFRVISKLILPKVRSLDTHQKWEKVLAKLTHVFLYFTIFALPLSGWVMSSAGEFPVSFFGLPVPALMGKSSAIFESSRTFHEVMALVLILVVGFHLVGALKHHVIDRDRTMMRMMNSKNYTFTGGLLVGLLFLILLGGNFLIAVKQNFTEFEKNGSAQHESTESNSPQVASTLGEIQPHEWSILKEKSHLNFEATQYGQAFSGSFNFDGHIVFDPEFMEGNTVSVTVDISSIKTGSEDRDAQALSEEWFDTQKFPAAVFESQSFEKQDANQYIAHGDLLIRGVRTPLDLPFSLKITQQSDQRVAEMQAESVLKRLDFGIGQGQWESTETIGNEVKITIVLHARQPLE